MKGLLGLASLCSLVRGSWGATCPDVPDALRPYKLGDGWSATKVSGNLTAPRDLIIDSAGRILVVESYVGIRILEIDALSGCATSLRTLIAAGDEVINHALHLSPDEEILYISTRTTVWAYPYDVVSGTLDTANRIARITGMLDGGHETRTLLIPPHRPDLLLVSHGSNDNFDFESIDPDVARAVVKVFDLSKVPDGGFDFVKDGWLAGYGLRNSVGLVFDANNNLWGVENSADDVNRTTATGESYSIVTNNPAEELNFLGDITVPVDNADAQWFGYPTCFTVYDPAAFSDATFHTGDQFVLAPNDTFNDASCVQQGSIPPRLTFPAHTAPLGATFDAAYRNMFVSLHGSWDRDPPQGYKVVAVPFQADGPVAAATDPHGFVDVFAPPDESICDTEGNHCARPVGLVFDKAGRLYFTSDYTGELFFLTRTA